MKKNTQTSNWLDNYNDSEVNLPQGFVGEGTFNGPKFDNPAWGGQFQNGGYLPLTKEIAKGRYEGDLKNMVYKKRPDGKYDITYQAPPEVSRQSIRAIKNIKPAGLVHSDLDIEAKLPEIRTEVKHPKSWKYNKIEGGSEESGYINSPEDFEHYIKLKNLYEDKEHKDWLGTKNKIDITPQYQMGGNLPGAVGNMYARTGSPSKGPRRNQTDVTDASAQNGKEMQYYQNGLDWKPKSISRDGSVIKDDRGQWDHPGEITEIGSNEITMKGVPYNVIGVSDTGDVKMMKPGKNYKFKGKKVTEYPMAKNGLRQEQKGLQNIDNLVNFTNYNKPTIGGWLNKYKS